MSEGKKKLLLNSLRSFNIERMRRKRERIAFQNNNNNNKSGE